jgi:hypothetical protein
MIAISRKKGRSGLYTKRAEELTDEQLAIIQDELDQERPLIASVRSVDRWFVITAPPDSCGHQLTTNDQRPTTAP